MQIKINNLSYYHNSSKDDFRFVNFNLELHAQHTTIIGSTGSGKSTLLELISGIEVPKKGSVDILDYHITNKTKFKDLKSLRKDCAVVFQNSENQFSETFVYHELLYGPKNHKMDMETAKNDALFLIERIGLTKNDLKKNINNFSGGQKRKIAIASMLMLRPKIIILDEPTIGLDPNSKADLMKFIYDYTNKYSIKLIIVSHDPYVIFNFSDEIVKLNNAQLEYCGDVESFRRYCSIHNLVDYFTKEQYLIHKFNTELNLKLESISEVRNYVKNNLHN